jgi:hypothetical protein
MSYKDSTRHSYKLAAKYTPPTIDTETFVITNGAKFMIDSDILGTTDPQSDDWQSYYLYDRTINRILYNLNCPVYHYIFNEHTVLRYNFMRDRYVFIDTIDLYVWSVLEGKPVVYWYVVDPHDKSYFLHSTIKERDVICSLRIDDYHSEKKVETIKKIYQRISDILFG